MPVATAICTNPMHDHEEAGTDIPASHAPASATLYDDGLTACLTEDAPMVCADCGKPTHYDRGAEAYFHDDSEAECFLHPALSVGREWGATPCAA